MSYSITVTRVVRWFAPVRFTPSVGSTPTSGTKFSMGCAFGIALASTIDATDCAWEKRPTRNRTSERAD